LHQNREIRCEREQILKKNKHRSEKATAPHLSIFASLGRKISPKRESSIVG
jgi:hypothetical protein